MMRNISRCHSTVVEQGILLTLHFSEVQLGMFGIVYVELTYSMIGRREIIVQKTGEEKIVYCELSKL